MIHGILPRDETVHPERFPGGSPAEGAAGDEAAMMRRLAEDASHIFLATGATDFRKQIPGLAAAVSMQFKLDPLLPAGRMAPAGVEGRAGKSPPPSKKKPGKLLFLGVAIMTVKVLKKPGKP